MSDEIDDIQTLLQAPTPREALERVRGIVQGYPGDEPPGDGRRVLVETVTGVRALANYRHGRWSGGVVGWQVVFYVDVVRWWELPG